MINNLWNIHPYVVLFFVAIFLALFFCAIFFFGKFLLKLSHLRNEDLKEINESDLLDVIVMLSLFGFFYAVFPDFMLGMRGLLKNINEYFSLFFSTFFIALTGILIFTPIILSGAFLEMKKVKRPQIKFLENVFLSLACIYIISIIGSFFRLQHEYPTQKKTTSNIEATISEK